MARKRHGLPHKQTGRRSPSPFHEADHSDYQESVSEKQLERKALACIFTHKQALTAAEIASDLSLERGEQKRLPAVLAELVHQKILHHTSKDRFSLGKRHGLASGILELNPRGFGFITGIMPEPAGATGGGPRKDPSVEAFRLGAARHGDTVLIRILKVRSDGRPEAEILQVLKRGFDRLAGFVVLEKDQVRVIPEDPRIPYSILIGSDEAGDKKMAPNLRAGDAVIVQLTADPANDRSDAVALRGSIIEILGDPATIPVQMRLVIEKFKLPHLFSPEAQNEAALLPDEAAEIAALTGPSNDSREKGREDLRDILHVTIDGETAKDFDDAVAVSKDKRGYRLFVSIADVSHFVQPGTALDKEAYERGTSIYFPGQVIPMLPERISNHLCSLIPDQDRLAFTAILDYNRQGMVVRKRFTKSIIRSYKRFTYTTVRQILIDKDQSVRQAHKPFLTPLKWAGELAAKLQKLRQERGAIGFTLPEPELSLDEQGRITAIGRAERNFAHQIIEEFMLSANEAVAELFTEHGVPALYRIHERPDPIKVQEFVHFAQTLGLNIPKHRQDPDWFGQILDMVKGTPREFVVNNLLLRTMQQARYDMKNMGHFGLAATDYTHFTSPIRRYPDLLVHRALQAFINRSKDLKKSRKQTNLQESGPFLSNRERVAVSAEREMNDRLKVRYMQDKIGESFEAVISGVNSFAFFVELLDSFVSGAVAIGELQDDYYNYDSKNHRLLGERRGKMYRIGDLVRVSLQSVDVRKNRINFALAQD